MKAVEPLNITKLRTSFLMKYFEILKKHEVRFAVLRSYKKIFVDMDKDVDLLMDPVDYTLAVSLFRDLLRKFEATFISSVVVDKNLYLKSLFVNGIDDDTGIDGLYIHITAYVTIKTSYKHKDIKYRGRKFWVDDFDVIEGEVQGVLLPVPEAKIQLLFIVTKYVQKVKTQYLDDMQEVIAEHSLQGWVSKIDKNNLFPNLFGDRSQLGSLAPLYLLISDMVMLSETKKSSGKLKNYLMLISFSLRQMFSYKGRLIFLSGPDGSGKTTANKALTQALIEKLKIPVINSKHLYPISNMTSLRAQKLQSKIRRIDFDNKTALERDRGHGFGWKSRRLVGLLYILIQIWPGYLYARYKNYNGYTVIIDTSFFDAFLKGHRPEFQILQWITVPLIPCGDSWFLMSASPEGIVARKPELTEKEIKDYYSKLDRIAKKSQCKPKKVPTNNNEEEALKCMVRALDGK